MNSRTVFALLVTSGVVLGGARPEAGQAAGAAPATTQPAQGADDPQAPAAGAQGPDAQRGAGDPQRTTDEPQAAPEEATLKSTPGAKALGMSILGNQEAPTSLVIVPWKTSELGRSPGIAPLLDDSRGPVDREVFMRALRYYDISSGATRTESATTGGRENTAAGSDAAQSTATRRR